MLDILASIRGAAAAAMVSSSKAVFELRVRNEDISWGYIQ